MAGRRRGRDRLLVAVAIVGSLAVVAFGVVGRSSPTPERLVAAVTSPGPEPSPGGEAMIDPDLLVVTQPSGPGVEITTRRLTIQGYLRGATAPVRVSLEARGNRVIDAVTIQPRGPFQVIFGLPNPRPNGRMVVSVMVLDPAGQPIDAVRWRVRIGAILNEIPTPAAVRPTPRPSLGEDGLMGGIVFP